MTSPRATSRLRGLVAILLIATALGAAGCGNSTKTVSSTGSNGQVTTQTVPNVHFAKTKFLLHTGLAFGAFHRYIYKPLRAGALRRGAPGRVRVLLKGAAATIFIVHELRLAHDDALSSDLLRPLATKIDAAGSAIGRLAGGLKSGRRQSGGDPQRIWRRRRAGWGEQHPRRRRQGHREQRRRVSRSAKRAPGRLVRPGAGGGRRAAARRRTHGRARRGCVRLTVFSPRPRGARAVRRMSPTAR